MKVDSGLGLRSLMALDAVLVEKRPHGRFKAGSRKREDGRRRRRRRRRTDVGRSEGGNGNRRQDADDAGHDEGGEHWSRVGAIHGMLIVQPGPEDGLVDGQDRPKDD
jgi:hypothetical protein